MARGLALGWRQPVLCTDIDAGRAPALADEVGGEAVASNAEVAQRADLVVLCAQARAARVGRPRGRAAREGRRVDPRRTPLRDVKAAYPDRPVYRVLPSTPVEVRQGAVIIAADATSGQPILDARVRELFAELGTLVELDDRLIDVAMGLMSTPRPTTRWSPRPRSTRACAGASRRARPRSS